MQRLDKRFLIRTRTCALALACVVASHGPAAACPTRLLATISLEAVHGLPLVSLSVGGAALNLILDTGAERTLLSDQAAKRLGLEMHRAYPQSLGGVGGTLTTAEAVLRDASAAGLALQDGPVMVGPIVLPPLGSRPTDGLLGADILADYDLDFDLAHRRLSFYSRQDCSEAAPAWTFHYATIAANRSIQGRLFFPARLDGHPMTAFIDSGSQMTVVDSRAALAAGLSQAALDRDPGAGVRGPSSQTALSRRHVFATLEVGDEALAHPTLLVTPFSLPEADLILGVGYLATRRVWLSYGAKEVFVAGRR